MSTIRGLLLEKGYFPKELPPAFTPKSLADKFVNISEAFKAAKLNIKHSQCIKYSIPIAGYARRDLGIPNPINQSKLSKTICDNWPTIRDFYNRSRISMSKPAIDNSGKRAIEQEFSYEEFKKANLEDSYRSLYELKADISRFYPTIYTHIIPWAIHTKPTAKSKIGDLGLLGNLLDRSVRYCQSNQTLGIPTGPDTSLIIAEIIGCELDRFLQEKFEGIIGHRYMDDYHLFFMSREEAEKVLRYLQHILADFELEINMKKTDINKFPIEFENEWSMKFKSFSFNDNDSSEQELDIIRFFNLSFQFARENPDDSVLKYAIKKLTSVRIKDDNWNIYESLLLKTAISEPVTLPDVTRILISHRKNVNKNKVETIIEELIKRHIPLGHVFEVSWALWLAKSFQIKIKDELAKSIFASNDSICILIALDLRENGLINSSIDTSFLNIELTEESLLSDKWLLTYESIIKKWLKPPKNTNPLSENPYFKILMDNKISFYDRNKQLDKITYTKEDRDRDSVGGYF